MHNGLTQDFLKRYLIAKDQFWWDAKKSPFALNLEHDWARVTIDPTTRERFEPYRVSYWRDRVLNLCEYDITHTNFGMTFIDLMNTDPATFEDIESRVHEIVKQREKLVSKENTLAEKNNLLKDGKR